MSEKERIRAEWSELLKKQNCNDMIRYLNSVILNVRFPLDTDFVVELLNRARDSDIQVENESCKTLKKDIDNYLSIYQGKAK